MAGRSSEAQRPVPAAGVERVLDSKRVLVDLRSPAEFAADHLPGAVNIPLFDDVERAIIGTLYRTAPDLAFGEAREFARKRIRTLVQDVASVCKWDALPGELEERVLAMTAAGLRGLEAELWTEGEPGAHDAVFYCWRGGLRSRSVVAFLRGLGLERASILDGGYRSYRRAVVRALGLVQFPRTFVLRGLTGVGKTLVLRELERIRPGWTVDLEHLAGHRSSILGMVGLDPATQKTFESRLLARIGPRGERLGSVVVFEGESRKVGDIVLPARLWTSLSGGTSLELVAPLERRVEVLVADYLATAGRRAELRAQLPFIEARLGRVKWKDELVRLLDLRREDELVRVLLERYYDPLYRHSERAFAPAATIDASDPSRAAREVAGWIEAQSG